VLMTLRSRLEESLHRAVSPMVRVVPPDQRTDLRHRLGRYHPWETGFDFAVPPIRPGEVTGPPDFVGVGVPMAGIGWWSALVADHPGVHRPGASTAQHFLSRFARQTFGPDDIQRYHQLFPRRPGTIAGEWTPTYLGDPWVPPLLASAAPEARLIVLVREPIERLQLGLRRSIDRRTANSGAHMAESIDRSFYARPLRQMLQYVPADRVLVLQYERVVEDPLGGLDATYGFLGLEGGHRPAGTRPPRPGPGLPPLDGRTEERLVDLYSADVADLVALVPTLDLSLWPRFAGTA
jgi:hypothetical protein